MANAQTTIRNINPLTVEVAPDLVASFDAVARATDEVALSTTALRRAAELSGITLAYFASPKQDSTPEHRHGYAVLQRLAIGKLAALLGTGADAFEPVFNSATGTETIVTIGGEEKTKRAWQQKVSNTLRPVKDAWLRSIRAEVEDAKQVLHYAKADLAKLEKEAEKTAANVEKVEADYNAVTAKVEDLRKQHATATGKNKAKLAAQVKAAEQAQEYALGVATLAEEADQKALLAVAEQREVIEECDTEVRMLSKALPATRGAKTRKSDAEAAIAKVDALIKTLSDSDGTGYGSADLAEAVYHLKQVRAALSL